MIIGFKYSIKNSIYQYINMLLHYRDFSLLRSVVWNPLFIFVYGVNQKKYINKAELIWKPLEKEVTDVFSTLGLKLKSNDIICFLHGISCEGWFDIDNNEIHVRSSNVTDGEFAGTVIHELVHLATVEKGQSYDEGEAIIDEYLSKNPLSEILVKIGDNPQNFKKM
jgi:hypothetical protein